MRELKRQISLLLNNWVLPVKFRVGNIQKKYSVYHFNLNTPYWGKVEGIASPNEGEPWNIVLVKENKVILKQGTYPNPSFHFPLYIVEREDFRDLWQMCESIEYSQVLLSCPLEPNKAHFKFIEYDEDYEGDMVYIAQYSIHCHGWSYSEEEEKAIREDGVVHQIQDR